MYFDNFLNLTKALCFVIFLSKMGNEEKLKIRTNQQIQLIMLLFYCCLVVISFGVTMIYGLVKGYNSSFFWAFSISTCLFICIALIVYIPLKLFHKVYLIVDSKKIIKKSGSVILFEVWWDEVEQMKYRSMTFNLTIKGKNTVKGWLDDFHYEVSISKNDVLKIKQLFYNDLKIK